MSQLKAFDGNGNENAADMIRLGFVGECMNGLGTLGLMNLYYDAYTRSADNELTGFLICDGKKIGQVIEGDHDSVYKMWNTIVNDQRYLELKVFEEQDSHIRVYEKWTLHVKDGLIMRLIYPQCDSAITEIDAASTEEVLGIMHSYSALVREY
jgi:hypothetical protein